MVGIDGIESTIDFPQDVLLRYDSESDAKIWIDVLSHLNRKDLLEKTVPFMGKLYPNRTVDPVWLDYDVTDLKKAFGRGWIYQETANTKLKEDRVRKYLCEHKAKKNNEALEVRERPTRTLDSWTTPELRQSTILADPLLRSCFLCAAAPTCPGFSSSCARSGRCRCARSRSSSRISSTPASRCRRCCVRRTPGSNPIEGRGVLGLTNMQPPPHHNCDRRACQGALAPLH